MQSLLADIRIAVRALRTSRGFALVTVLTLGVAIGATTAIYSVVDAVLLRPLPYPAPERLVRVSLDASGRDVGELPFSDAGFRHFAEGNRSFERFGGFNTTQWPLASDGEPVQVDVAMMTVAAFEAIGVSPMRGRVPAAEEDLPGAPPVALISRALWTERFGGGPAILERTMDLNGVTVEIIGVMPAGYDFPSPDTDIWVPYRLDPANPNFGGHHINAIGRLRDGIEAEAVHRDAEELISRFGEAGYGPEWLSNVFSGRANIQTLQEAIVGDVRRPLLVIFGTVAFVLLIACSNVANLLLVRAESRSRESAVRVALGAGRWRLIQGVLTESVILGLAGGVLGLLLALVGTRLLVSMGPPSIPRLHEIRMSGSVLAFTAAVSLGAGILFGLFPAFRVWARDSMGALRDGGRGATIGRDRHRARRVLVVTQVALALVLLVGSGLMVRTFQELRSVDTGFRAEGVITFSLSPPPSRYAGPTETTRFYSDLLRRLREMPGVTSAGGVTLLPLAGRGAFIATQIEDFPVAEGDFPAGFAIRRATPGYFEALGIPLMEGRTFEDRDHEDRLGGAIVSASFRQRYWPATSAVGKRVGPSMPYTGIIGVVGDVHTETLAAPVEPIIYLPMVDSVGGGVRPMTIAVRTVLEPGTAMAAIRREVSAMDPALPITNLRTLSATVEESMSRTTFTMSLLVLAAMVALFLGAVGVYGVISYVVSQRSAEMGVRQALGAAPADVRSLVLHQGLALVAVGVVVGLAAAGLMGRLLSSLLYGVSPFDVVTFSIGAVVFLSVGLFASMIPAVRAARIEPAVALREG
jgi:putative ABC transport system permease protein